ncbi:hypothetical protein Q3G72_028653 [Acer saccharum]|nr:hypothetical protein Q3G72_028653 [Acer saccharum]
MSLSQETFCEATRTITTTANINAAYNIDCEAVGHDHEAEQQTQAIAVAMATTAAAQAAVATAQAAVEAVRLTKPSFLVKKHCAAIVIQTVFRGYLERKRLSNYSHEATTADSISSDDNSFYKSREESGCGEDWDYENPKQCSREARK